ncbi:hypothetical protein EW146_g6271 [Bondarzewia mesenterica]|uniref:CRAL-TRIO domain-containing protein n=1 Tax=Bondarzewia mesenterica TaxID=1095465 RepID=A0A4S4LP38_9AGAM|nr:hypothetical protein EW146_g6271 [Bondarzewia mesenterica]
MNSHRTSTYDLLAGHLGHLSEEQLKHFAVFKDNLAKASLYKPPSETVPASHDEATILRFLRARRFDPHKAQKQFSDTEAWRFATPSRPLICYLRPRPMQTELNSISVDRRYQRIVALWEFMSQFTLPLCSALPHPGAPVTPISAVTSIIDLSNVSLGTMWSLRHHLQQASELATAHYPETLHTIAVVNAPVFFPTVWGWIKVWFDEGTRNKVHVLGKDPGPTLRTIIDAKDLPQLYGGELEWTFSDEPALDEHAKVLVDEVPKGPITFVDGKAVRPEVPKRQSSESQEGRYSGNAK